MYLKKVLTIQFYHFLTVIFAKEYLFSKGITISILKREKTVNFFKLRVTQVAEEATFSVKNGVFLCTRIAALTRFSQAVSEHGNSSSKTGGCSLNILYTGKGCGIKILVSRKVASASFCPFGFVSCTAALSLFLFLAPAR